MPRTGRWSRGAACALLLTVVGAAALTGCQRPSAGEGSASGGGDALAGALTPSGYGATFLGAGECSSRGHDFREVSCASEKAVARVLVRHEGPMTEGHRDNEPVTDEPVTGRPAADRPTCPPRTDFVLHISESRPALDEDGDGSVPRGFGCMRNLEEPHPGDPGNGGGPRTVVGDCVHTTTRKGRVKETPCDGSGAGPPEFEVAAAVDRRAQCPPATALYVQLSGGKPVGCARRV
ncbi:hypothetical protein [Streptomyces chryseus]|uniref:hypothetical protein n=1 Tax=Streptomyces chryseus TaxID=68186 RepID=UPI00110FB4A4|nr:hypothetical protein [Streptomyces chryseus]GGX19651.1 hypothetical protein GCM10010353_38400 [Streptomyces chryseus]